MWLGHIGAVNVTNSIKAEIYLLNEEENGRRVGIRSGFTDKLFCSTWDQVNLQRNSFVTLVSNIFFKGGSV